MLVNENKPVPRVLLIEDDPVSQNIIEKLLSKIGIVPVIAATAEQAREHLESENFALLILDIVLPGISGIDFTKEIRAKEKGSTNHLLIVAITGQVSDEDKKACYAAGVDGYFPKPISRSILLEFLRNLLKYP